MTHVRRLQDLDEPLARYFEAIAPLVASAKLGPVLWQLPANFRRDEDRLADALERFPPGRHCFEFRHESWFTEDVLRSCARTAPRWSTATTPSARGSRSS